VAREREHAEHLSLADAAPLAHVERLEPSRDLGGNGSALARDDADVIARREATQYEETTRHSDGERIGLVMKFPVLNAEGGLSGVGGIATAEHAWERIRAGASLVQLYSAMVYEGPGIAAKIVRGLPALMARDGFSSIAEAVGTE